MRLRVLAAGVLSIVAATRVFADVCNPNDPRLLKPDLVAQSPSKVRFLTRSGHRRLMFTTTIANVGDGPLVLDGQTVNGPNGSGTRVTQEIRRNNGTTCTHDVGFFPFTAGDERFRIDDFAEYQLRQDDPFSGPIVASFSKTEFCLLNIVQLRGSLRPPENFDCENGPRGISVGFATEEDGLAPGQSLDLDANPTDPVPPGNYFLVIVVNPNGAILEKSGDPEASVGVASIDAGGSSSIPRRPPPRPPRPTPRRPGRPGAFTPTPAPGVSPGPAATPTANRPVHPVRPPIALPPGHEGCGGNKHKLCSPGEFCQFAENRCTLAEDVGICTPMNCRPDLEHDPNPVCGCDGVTYQNDCQRQRAGISRAHKGPC